MFSTGNIIYAHLFNKPVVAINSEEVAKDLFEGHSIIYSDKPQSIVYPYLFWFLLKLISIRFVAFFILHMIYDYELKAKNDPIAHNMKKYMNWTNTALVPVLKLPSWFPGATFKQVSLECLKAGHNIKEILFQMSTSIMVPCIVADTLSKIKLFAEDDTVIITAVKEAASMAFADRLPNFNDRPSLPYVDTILCETLRWHPVVPFGIPHTTTTSDIYKGYFIPEGLAMAHNKKKYPNPGEFKPERFLHEDGSLTSDTMPLGFGWGRQSYFLAMFSVHNAHDEHGIDIPVIAKFYIGLIVHPEKFPCCIVPQFPDASVKRLTHLTGLSPYVNIA
ncbi:cytochrome P450 [Suillus americanus]|nr:cytochrome P450 [Suillus americanus]